MKHSTLTMFRRVMALSLALLLVVGLTGCFGKDEPAPTDPPAATDAPTEAPTEKPTAAPTEAPTEPPVKGVMGTVSANNLNVRSNHVSDASILSQLPVNLRVEILEQKTVSGTNWGRIGKMTLPNGNTIDGGWINLHYVKLDVTEGQTSTGTDATTPTTGATTVDPDEEKLGTITAEQLSIRKGAGTTYDTAGSYKKGDRVKILEQKTVSGTTWGRTDKGWISLTYVKLDGSLGTAVDTGTNVAQPGATKPTTGSSTGTGTGTGTGTSTGSGITVSNGKTTVLGYVVVDCGGLTLRSGPATTYKSLGAADEGDRYPYYQTSNGWYRTSHGWLSNANEAYLYIEGTVAADAGIAVVKAQEMYVRQGPGTNFTSVTTLKQNESLAVLGKADGWGYTRLGWINLDGEYVNFTAGLTYTTGAAKVIASGLNVRASASDDATKLGTLASGTSITVTEISSTDKNWGKISYDGKDGWIHMSYVKMTSASSSSTSTTQYDIVDIVYNDTMVTSQVSVNTAKCTAGTEVVLTINPIDTKAVDKVEVKYGTASALATKVSDTQYKFTMPASDVSIEISFKDYKVTYTITRTATDPCNVIAKVGGTAVDSAAEGDKVTLSYTPVDHYTFVKYEVKDSDGGDVTVTSNEFTMPAKNVTVTATFEKTKYTINTVFQVIEGSFTTNKDSAEKKAYYNDPIELTITPNTGYKVKSVTYTNANGIAVNATKVSDTKYTFNMPGDTTVTVLFESTT